MTAPDCSATREVAAELALGLLDGDDRAAALEHVHRCPSCQAVVSELAGIADLLAQLAPEADPPPGFDARVVAATRRSRRIRRRWVAGIAVVAAAAAIGAVAIVRIVDASRSETAIAAPRLRSAPMQGASGQHVGRVVATTGAPAAAAVMVDYAVPDGDYEIMLRRTGGASTRLGRMTIRDGRGEWSGRVARPGDAGRLELVDAAGAVVCGARFPA
jgi:predicted anti-sigma-YlaC factor YlaD